MFLPNRAMQQAPSVDNQGKDKDTTFDQHADQDMVNLNIT